MIDPIAAMREPGSDQCAMQIAFIGNTDHGVIQPGTFSSDRMERLVQERSGHNAELHDSPYGKGNRYGHLIVTMRIVDCSIDRIDDPEWFIEGAPIAMAGNLLFGENAVPGIMLRDRLTEE